MAGIKKTRKAARKRVTKRRRSGLKIKSTAKKLLRRMFRMRGGGGITKIDDCEKLDNIQTIDDAKFCLRNTGIYAPSNTKLDDGVFEHKKKIVDLLKKLEEEHELMETIKKRQNLEKKGKPLLNTARKQRPNIIKDAKSAPMEFSTKEIKGKINKIGYCALSVVISPSKVLYLQKYPPAGGAFEPLNDKSNKDDLKVDEISQDKFIDFWSSEDSYQPNGNWKGGAWGTNNCPTTDETWLTGVFINDEVNIKPIKRGILKFQGGKQFADNTEFIPKTESAAWTVNVMYNGNTYGAYLTNNIMPQRANDVLFIWENQKNEQYIKLLTRGNSPNVDMPQRMMPGAGEHLEPGVDVKLKEGVLRAVQEEIGIEESALTDAYLLKLGTYDTLGRDPRYWTFNWKSETDKDITFGMKRGSSSEGYVIYIKSKTDVAPAEKAPKDTEEVNSKWWAKLINVLDEYPDKRWMIIDHKQFIPVAAAAIKEFKEKSPADQESLKFKTA